MQTALGACALAAGASLAVLAASGRPRAGVALAAGLLIGSVNPWLARRTLGMDVSFWIASLGRLAALTIAGLGAGLLLGAQDAVLTVVGLGVAQLLIAGLAARAVLERAGG